MGCGAGTARKGKNCRCLKNEKSDLHAAAGGRCIECIKKAVTNRGTCLKKLGLDELGLVELGLENNKLGLDEPRDVPHAKGRTEFRNVEATPLMLAVCWGDNDMIMALLKLGADVTVEVPVTSNISDLRAAKVLECGDDQDPGLANAVDYMVAFNHYAATIPSLSETPLLPETVKAMHDARDTQVGIARLMNIRADLHQQNAERKQEQFRAEWQKGYHE